MLITMIACHSSQSAIASLVPSEKYCTLLGSWKAYPKLQATQSPSFFSQFRTLDMVCNGRLPILNMLCHLAAGGAEDEAMFDPTAAEGRGL